MAAFALASLPMNNAHSGNRAGGKAVYIAADEPTFLGRPPDDATSAKFLPALGDHGVTETCI